MKYTIISANDHKTLDTTSLSPFYPKLIPLKKGFNKSLIQGVLLKPQFYFKALQLQMLLKLIPIKNITTKFLLGFTSSFYTFKG